MKQTFLLILLIFLIISGYSQTDTTVSSVFKNKFSEVSLKKHPQAIYFQLLGSGPVLSILYDQRFNKKPNGLGFSGGVGYIGIEGYHIYSIPISINYLFGHRKHFFELGTGATYISKLSVHTRGNGIPESGPGIFYHINAGYRYQPAKGFFFKGGLSPLFTGFSEKSFNPYFIYIGLGHSF